MLYRFFKAERGATAVEYALVASLIAIAAIGGFQIVGTSTGNLFDSNESEISNALN